MKESADAPLAVRGRALLRKRASVQDGFEIQPLRRSGRALRRLADVPEAAARRRRPGLRRGGNARAAPGPGGISPQPRRDRSLGMARPAAGGLPPAPRRDEWPRLRPPRPAAV